MDYYANDTILSRLAKVSWTSILWILLLALVVYFVSTVYLQYPRYGQAVPPMASEGFFGGVARGAGHPDCLRTLNDGAELLALVMTPETTNKPDFVEFQVLLSKLGCLKKDLMSPSGIVEATRYQPYETAHDREPVAEVAATCLNRTIPKRDLDIIFQTWKDRGNVLLKRLCTLAELTEAQVVQCEKLFANSWIDVYEVAQGRCIATAGEIKAAVDDARPYEPVEVKDLGEYNGYYSGWSGGNV